MPPEKVTIKLAMRNRNLGMAIKEVWMEEKTKNIHLRFTRGYGKT